MFNSLKSAVAAAVCLVAVSSAAQAQFSLTSPTLTTTNTTTSTTTTETQMLEFDSEKGILTINGCESSDLCYIDIGTGYRFELSMKTASGMVYGDYAYYQLKQIVFNGNGGNDTFQFTDHAMTTMMKYEAYYVNLICDLRGGAGLDTLSGGVGCDILSGGNDDEEDILTGGPGADIFLNQRDRVVKYYFSSYSLQSNLVSLLRIHEL